jgi:uncharacterized protein
VAKAIYWTAIGLRPAEVTAIQDADRAADQEAGRTNQISESSTNYPTVVAGRIRFMPHRYSRPWMYLPTNEFALFLIGMLALRVGVFDEPERHGRLILGWSLFGILAWAAAEWLPWPSPPAALTPGIPLPVQFLSFWADRWAFMLVRDTWLSFAYIGGIVWLMATKPKWLARLSPFGVTGRMALTNYVLQVMILDLTFSSYGLALKIGAAWAALPALALFVIDVAICRWWLARFYYGPLEWLWRSATYARWQPFRRTVAAMA